MDRRNALKRIGLSFGSIAVSSGIISLVQSCNSNNDNYDYSFFNRNKINFLNRILEIIIPETDSPGANALSLSKFIDAYISRNISSEDQNYLNVSIDEFIKMIVTSENKLSIEDVDNKNLERYFAEHIDNESMIANDGKNYSEICNILREMGVNSYMANKYVMINMLGFVSVPGYYDGNVDI